MRADWRPTVSVGILQLRARMLSRVRAFFAARGVMEVETPALSQAATIDPNLASFTVPTAEGERYLHTSPEFPMKRLLAAGSGDIYQICKAFRADEMGRHHNPEFSLLEWYRVGYDHIALMDEVEALLDEVFADARALGSIARFTYREALMRYAGLDILTATAETCRACASAHGIEVRDELGLQQWLELLMSQVVMPACAEGFTFIYDYPPEQAALARIRPGNPPLAERFELLGYGLELANGFHELADVQEQRARFERELRIQRERGLPTVPVDERLLAALEHGLPDCSGVALGLDRLVMLAADVDDIAQAMAFSWCGA